MRERESTRKLLNETTIHKTRQRVRPEIAHLRLEKPSLDIAPTTRRPIDVTYLQFPSQVRFSAMLPSFNASHFLCDPDTLTYDLDL